MRLLLSLLWRTALVAGVGCCFFSRYDCVQLDEHVPFRDAGSAPLQPNVALLAGLVWWMFDDEL